MTEGGCHQHPGLRMFDSRKLQGSQSVLLCVLSVCVWGVILANRLLWAFFRAKQKLEQLWCALHCGRRVCVWQCVGVRDDEGVAHSTGHVCGKHCMHTKDRWKGRSGWAGSKEQKKHIIWFIRWVQIGLIRWRKTIMEEKEKVCCKWDWESLTEAERLRDNGGREDNCSSGRESAVNNERSGYSVCAPGKTKPQPQLKQTLTP